MRGGGVGVNVGGSNCGIMVGGSFGDSEGRSVGKFVGRNFALMVVGRLVGTSSPENEGGDCGEMVT